MVKHSGLWSPRPRFKSAQGYNFIFITGDFMITVLRLGHRFRRDERISTHCGLVARALGAQEIIYTGDKDEKMMESVKNVTERWGGNFKVSYKNSYKYVINKYKSDGFKTIHLTMYWIPIQKKIDEIKKFDKLLIIIGGEKVPGDVYQMVDYNIAVTNQPHSEIAALAIILDFIQDREELEKEFHGKIKVIPQERGKKVLKEGE